VRPLLHVDGDARREIEDHLGLGQIEIERAAAHPVGAEDARQIPHHREVGLHRLGLGARLGQLGEAEGARHARVGELRGGAHVAFHHA
jgi:hypothetical protein